VNNIELMKNNINNVYLAELYLKRATEYLRDFILHVPEYRGDSVDMIYSHYEKYLNKSS
jgi:hypothetical protein